jgi:hypothetical protein
MVMVDVTALESGRSSQEKIRSVRGRYRAFASN